MPPETDWEALDGWHQRVDPAPWLMRVWRCWHDLDAERPLAVEGFGSGMGKQRVFSRPRTIPVSAIHQWCRDERLGAREADFVFGLVRVMERVAYPIRVRQSRNDVASFFA